MCSLKFMTSLIPWQRVRTAGNKQTTPLHPDDYLRLLNPLWSERELRGRVGAMGQREPRDLTVPIPGNDLDHRAAARRWRARSYSSRVASTMRSHDCAGGVVALWARMRASRSGSAASASSRSMSALRTW